MKQNQSFHDALESLDDKSINTSRQPSLNQLVNEGRRNLLKGGAALAISSLFPSLFSPLAHAISANIERNSLINFQSVEAVTSSVFDIVSVPPGYRA